MNAHNIRLVMLEAVEEGSSTFTMLFQPLVSFPPKEKPWTSQQFLPSLPPRPPTQAWLSHPGLSLSVESTVRDLRVCCLSLDVVT